MVPVLTKMQVKGSQVTRRVKDLVGFLFTLPLHMGWRWAPIGLGKGWAEWAGKEGKVLSRCWSIALFAKGRE